MKILIAYFSAGGRTAGVAKSLAEATGGDLWEIKPEVPYTTADIKWTNPLSRCNKEKFGKKDVPVSGTVDDFEDYDLVFVGFPIWYSGAPNVVSTFCKGYDWSGKRVMLFATSGGSGMGKTAQKLLPSMPGGQIEGERLIKDPSEVKDWAIQILEKGVGNE